jgi:hypothetical protein
MNSFVFEIYENCEKRGRIFKGYKTVKGETSESALLSAQETYGEDYIVCPIYFPL